MEDAVDLCLRFKLWPTVEEDEDVDDDECDGIIVIPAPKEGNDVWPPIPLTPPTPLPPVLLTKDEEPPGKQRYNDIEGEGKCCINLPF